MLIPIFQAITFGIASWYGAESGSTTANGQRFSPYAHTCAMRSEPFGERVEIVNTENGKSSWCRITDRGPFIAGRVIDVTPRVRDELGFDGLASVYVFRVVGYLPGCHPKPQHLTCKAPPPHLCVLNLPKPAVLECP